MTTHSIAAIARGAAGRLAETPMVTVLALLLCLCYLYFFAARATLEFELVYDNPQPSLFKVYWAGEGEGYSESRMNQVLVTDYRRQYRLFLSGMGNLQRLRIDPIEYPGTVTLGDMVISQLGYRTEKLDSGDALNRIVPVQQALSLSEDEGRVLISTTGVDGQFQLVLSPQRVGVFPGIHVLNVALIFVVVLWLGRYLGFLFEEDRYVPCCMVIALLLIIAMAGITGINVHPDEAAHHAAVRYYSEHLLPPTIDSQAAQGSFSVYGYSRLANFEAYYPLAGYFTWLLKPINLPAVFDARVFGIALFALLAVLTLLNRSFRIFAVPLLISAQTWYLFSYANSDGFAIFAATLVAWQAADENSRLNALLSDPADRDVAIWLVLFGLLFGLLLLSKTNFYFFILFLGAYLLWRIFNGDFPDRKRLWVRICVIGAVAVSVYAGRVAVDYAVNGPDPRARVAAAIEENAEYQYKPSTPLEEKNIYLDLKDRGFSLDRIIHAELWLEKTLYSAFGAYGFTQYFGSRGFYEMVYFAGMALLVTLLFGALVNGPASVQALFMIAAVCILALVGSLLWRSWTISFQPQGRYLAPALPILAILYYHLRPCVSDRIVMVFTCALFLLGVYSFIFIGLHDIWKSPLYS